MFTYQGQGKSHFRGIGSMAITALRRIFCGEGRRRRRNSPDGYTRDDEGSAAVEFALTAPLFFAVLLSIFEFAMLFGTNVLLEAASNNAARAIRTGKIFTGSLPALIPNDQALALEAAMCDGLLFINCGDLSYNVQVFPNFGLANANLACDPTTGAISGSAPPDGEEERPAKANFDIGGPAQIVVLTVFYPYKPLLPNPLTYAGQDWESSGGCNGLSMKSVLVFVNEPFPRTVPVAPPPSS